MYTRRVRESFIRVGSSEPIVEVLSESQRRFWNMYNLWKNIWHCKENGKQLSIVFIDMAKALPWWLFSQEPRSCPDNDA